MARVSDEDFIKTWHATGGRAAEVARILGFSGPPKVYDRRKRVEIKTGVGLPSAGDNGKKGRGDAGKTAYDYNPRLHINGYTGKALIFTDAHFWPGLSRTLAYRALLEVAREEKPGLLICDGDMFDGASISRFGASRWETTPDVYAELNELGGCCDEISRATPKSRKIRTIGNHDDRFDKMLANQVGSFRGVRGFRLSDHLPDWEETMSIWVNGHTVIKHRWHGGAQAAWNNVMKSGVTMATGHTHTLLCRPYVDYRGRRYGIECGTLADPQGPQFAYAEDNPTQACSGFVLLTFDKEGRVLYPELCEVVDGAAYFRGGIIATDRQKKRAA